MRSLTDGAGKVVLLLVATALCLGLAEIALRIHHAFGHTGRLRDVAGERPLPPPGSVVSLGDLIQLSPHERLIFELRPNLDVRFSGARVRTNSRGWRDAEYPHEKPPRTIRIVGIGDSVAFGWAVAEEERYTSRLEILLNESHPQHAWQVLTLACPGYNLVMELEALERYGLDYDPDMILYGYVANDACLPNFVAEDSGTFGRNSFLLGYVAKLWQRPARLVPREGVLDEPEASADFATKYCTPEAVPARYRAFVGEDGFRRALARLAELGVERGIRVVLVAHPIRREFPLPDVPPGVSVVHGLGKPGTPGSVMPLPELRVSRFDPHPNSAGHAIIARNVFETLAADGVWDDLMARNRIGAH